MSQKLRVTVWGENVHERENPLVAKIYPDGMHNTISDGIREGGEFDVRAVTLHDPEHGLTTGILENSDVLVWWSKPFMRLMGTSCSVIWREAGEKERLWVCNPAHPIARGIDRYFEIENVEMYGEPFAVPTPDEIVFISWFEGGEVFRSGCTWKRGNGKIFYFRPGHEAYPIYYNKNVRLVLRNAVRWAAGDGVKWIDSCPQISAKDAPELLEIKGPKIHKEGEAGFR
ncbi:MAG: trehalose utilization protein ThuA [Verrucomicrobia bacterium]|nr:MAG: trehalose utilization protein ThuA [Verrucomicrobiota bacterium]